MADDLDPVGLAAAEAALDRMPVGEMTMGYIASETIRAYLKALRDKGPQL